MNTFEDKNVNYVDLAMQSIRTARLAAKLKADKEGPPKTLKDEIVEWHENLPPGEKEMSWSMSFLSARFNSYGSVLGPLLSEELGWRRDRDWKGKNATNRRKWFPPTQIPNEELNHAQK